MERRKRHKGKHSFFRQAVSYGIIGGLSSGLDARIFYLLNHQGHVAPYSANIISIHCGILCSFLLNRTFTFRMRDHIWRRLALFYGTGLLGLLISQLLLLVGTMLEQDPFLVKLCSIVVVAAFQFLLNRVIAFGQPRE